MFHFVLWSYTIYRLDSWLLPKSDVIVGLLARLLPPWPLLLTMCCLYGTLHKHITIPALSRRISPPNHPPTYPPTWSDERRPTTSFHCFLKGLVREATHNRPKHSFIRWSVWFIFYGSHEPSVKGIFCKLKNVLPNVFFLNLPLPFLLWLVYVYYKNNISQ